jgi:hypothetical protein
LGTRKLSTYSFAEPPSKSKTDMPMSASEGRLIGVKMDGQKYESRLASFAAPVQHATVVQTDAKQLQPDA